MDQSQQLEALIDLAESLGMEIRRRPAGGDGRGGDLVRLRGRELLFLDLSASPADQVEAVASALRGRGEIQDRFIAPEIRTLIERAGQ